MNYFNITNNNIKHQIKGYSTYWTKNNLLHRCITDKDSCNYVIDTTRSKIQFSS